MLHELKVKTILIEDQEVSHKYLVSLIEKNFSSIKIVQQCSSIQESIKAINKHNPELIFMDIKLSDGLAFDIFKHINTVNFEVIFITAYEDYIKKAIDHFAFSYIVKPYDETEFITKVTHYLNLKERLSNHKNLDLLVNFLTTKNPSFLIQVGDEYISIILDSIIICEAKGNYTHFNLSNGKKYLASKSLKYYEGLLKNKGFFRAHRSMLVNIKHIASIYKKETLILKNNNKIHVSVRNKTRLTELINSIS